MEATETPLLPTPEQIIQNHTWWNDLSEPWKRAYNEVILMRSVSDMPEDHVLHNIRHAIVMRFAGPTAPYPNMTFELDDLSGLVALEHLNILVVTHHRIKGLEEISHLAALKSLFVFNNQISSLNGVESLENLTELYFQGNLINSLKLLENMTKLATIYCNDNPISLLDGIGIQHKGTLQTFACLPNKQLLESEIIRMEREIGIRCVKG